MSRQSLAKFDPSQAVSPLVSSAGFSPLPQEEGLRSSTSGPPAEQLFVDPASIPSYEKPPFESNPLLLNATVLPGNSPSKDDSVAPVVFLKREPIVQPRFVPLQKWEGSILQVLDDSFFARLIDLTSGGSDEEAEFPIEEVSDADRSLVEPGAVFYWNIGYIDSISGQRTRSSMIRFRRLPVWRSEELERARRRAQRLSDLLGWK